MQKLGFEHIDPTLSQLAEFQGQSSGSKLLSNFKSPPVDNSRQSYFEPDSYRSSLPHISLTKRKSIQMIKEEPENIKLSLRFRE